MTGALVSGRITQLTDILEMNNQELSEYLKKLEMENPLVELREDRNAEGLLMTDVQRKLVWLSGSDEQNRVYYQQEMEDDEDPEVWKLPMDPEDDLAEFVCAQLLPSCNDEKDREILYFLANSLDENGYLSEDIPQIQEKFRIQEAEAKRYMYLLQSADPAGIGARTLRECLLLQLDRLPSDMVIARRIILECLDLLSENRIAKIAIRLGISMEEAEENCRLIRKLNPRPGSGFSARENLRYLQPDVTVIRFQDYFQVMLNDTNYPRIHISSYYKKLLKDEELSEEAASYIRDHLNQARWVRRSIELRGNHLVNLMKCLIQEQKAFFEKGPDYRKTIDLAGLQQQLGLSEEEVKALCKDKYVQCHWGIFPLVFLLARGESIRAHIQLVKDEDPAAQARQAIRHIIAREDKRHPASDQKITDQLQEMGIQISRRTVAKYRSQMGIREASGRREWPEEE